MADPASGPARWAMEQYFAEIAAQFGFETGSALDDAAAAYSPPRGVFVLAGPDEAPLACGALQYLDEERGEVKRMWVHRDWRGAGLGGRLLRHLEATAVDLGGSRVVLDTHRVLAEAVALYERAGYREIERYNDNPYAQAWFEKRVAPDPGAGPTLSR